MRIVYIYSDLLTRGGTDRIITQKANYMADVMKYEVFIVTDSQIGRVPVFPISSNVKHIDLDINFWQEYGHSLPVRTYFYFKLMRLYRKRLEKLLIKLKPDITIATVGRSLDFLAELKDGSKKIVEAHTSKPFLRNFHLLREKSFVHRLIAKYWTKKMENAVKQLDAFVVLTPNDAQSWSQTTRATIISNALPFYPETTSPLTNKEVISVGRLSEEKGFDLLIQSWKSVHTKHPDWKLNIYGEGVLKHDLDEQIKTLKLENSCFIHPPVTDIQEKYQENAFYVMSSRFEGFGLALVEAMSYGLPCISFDCPYGPSNIIKDRKDGLLVENGNVQALADGICHLIEHEDIRRKLGQNARKNILRYSPEKIMKQWDDLFHSLMEHS